MRYISDRYSANYGLRDLRSNDISRTSPCTWCDHRNIHTNSPNHAIRKPPGGTKPRWSFDHHLRVFVPTPIAARVVRVLADFSRLRHEASPSRYILDINRRSNEIDPRYHGAHEQPSALRRQEDIPPAAFVFARASDTRRRLIAHPVSGPRRGCKYT